MKNTVKRDGQSAFLAGLTVGENPHPEDSEAHWQWMAGWADEGMKKVRTRLANTRQSRAPAASAPGDVGREVGP